MAAQLNNWVNTASGPTPMSVLDKIKELLLIRDKLVLVQLHEVERIKEMHNPHRLSPYIEMLYKHYVTEGKPKLYLCQ